MKYTTIAISTLAIIFFSISACKDKEQTTQNDNTSTFVVSNDPYIANTQKLLQGTWINLDEKGVTLKFEGNTRIENIAGKPEGKTRYFEIADECKNDAAGDNRIVKARAKYISMQDIDLCYYIINLDQSHLELKTVGRGTIVKYKKKGAKERKQLKSINLSKAKDEK